MPRTLTLSIRAAARALLKGGHKGDGPGKQSGKLEVPRSLRTDEHVARYITTVAKRLPSATDGSYIASQRDYRELLCLVGCCHEEGLPVGEHTLAALLSWITKNKGVRRAQVVFQAWKDVQLGFGVEAYCILLKAWGLQRDLRGLVQVWKEAMQFYPPDARWYRALLTALEGRGLRHGLVVWRRIEENGFVHDMDMKLALLGTCDNVSVATRLVAKLGLDEGHPLVVRALLGVAEGAEDEKAVKDILAARAHGFAERELLFRVEARERHPSCRQFSELQAKWKRLLEEGTPSRKTFNAYLECIERTLQVEPRDIPLPLVHHAEEVVATARERGIRRYELLLTPLMKVYGAAGEGKRALRMYLVARRLKVKPSLHF
eukprot:Sspe_Gene.41930::Locus_20302_Transcript_1_1_Confidence_1.000_Length_1179::g.41930::m.41930